MRFSVIYTVGGQFSGLAVGLYSTNLGQSGGTEAFQAIFDEIELSATGTTPALSIDDVFVDEDAGAAVFTVSLSQPAGSSISFDFSTANGTAGTKLNAEDYESISGSRTIVAGQLSTTIEVPIIDDIAIEGNETFTVNITNASGAVITDGTAIGTIIEDDGTSLPSNLITFDFTGTANQFDPSKFDIRPSFSFTQSGITLVATARELLVDPLTGQETGTVQTVDVTQTKFGLGVAGASDLAGSNMIFANQIDGNGIDGANDGTGDYEELILSVLGDSRVKIQTISFGNGNGDDDWTLDVGGVELISRNASTDPSNLKHDISSFAAVGNQFVLGVLSNTSSDDYAVKQIQVTLDSGNPSPDALILSIDATSISENGGSTTATVTRTGDTTAALTVNLFSSDSTEATVPTSVTIAAGQAFETFTITAVDDADVDGTQTSTITGIAAGFLDGSATLDVTDDDAAPTVPQLNIESVTVNEGGGIAEVFVTLSEPNSSVTVDYATSDGSATAGSDFAPNIGTLSFATGQAQTITVQILEDSSIEGSEFFTINLTNPVNATIVDGTGVVTIADNDSPGQTGTTLYRVNAGGSEIAAIDGGPNWTADTATGNSLYLVEPGNNKVGGFSAVEPGSTVPSTTPGGIFDTERWDGGTAPEMSWSFPVPAVGLYEVRLYMGNGWNGSNDPGERVFDVSIEGQVPANLDNVDLSGQFGHLVGAMISNTLTVSDGFIDIEFLHGVENPLVNGIEIIQLGGGTPSDPTVSLVGGPLVVSEAPAEALLSLETDVLVPAGETVSVTFEIVRGTATPQEDYEYLSTSATYVVQTGTYTDTLVIAGNSSSVSLGIAILPDTIEELDEAFTVNILSVSNNAVLGTDVSTTVTILDDDTPTADLSLTQSLSDSTPLVSDTITISLTLDNLGPSDASGVSVEDLLPSGLVYVSDNSGGAYDWTTGIWTVGTVPALGSVTLDITADVISNGIYSNYAQVLASDVADPDSIPGNDSDGEDDDSTATITVGVKPTVSIVSGSVAVSEGSGQVQVSLLTDVTVAADETVQVTFEIVPLPGEALPELDYAYPPGTYDPQTGIYTGTVVIAGSSSDTTILIDILPDTEQELDESFTFNLIGVSSNAQLGTSSATITIQDDDDDSAATLYRVNAGGSEIAAIDGGPNWTADTATGNSLYLVEPGNNKVGGFSAVEPGSTVPSTTPGGIFDTERWDGGTAPEMSWSFPVPAVGLYEVRLYMGNGWNGSNDPGERVFDVSIEGQVPANLDNVDLSGQFGHLVGAMISNTLTVSDGFIDIEFLHGVENPLVNGIEIIQLGGGTPSDPTVSLVGGPLVVSEAPAEALLSLETDVLVPAGETVSVTFEIVRGTATPQEDYEYLSTSATYVVQTGTYTDTLVIAGNSSSVSLGIAILPDTIEELDEAFTVNILSVSNNAVLGTDVSTTVTILDDDTPTADLSLTQSLSDSTPLVSDTITISLTLDNLGPSDASGVSVEDLLPSGLVYVSDNSGGAYDWTTGIWTVGTVPALGSVTLDITADVISNGIYSNYAQVLASDVADPDSIPGNDSDGEDDDSTATITVGVKPTVSIVSGSVAVSEGSGQVQVSLLTDVTVAADETVQVTFEIVPLPGEALPELDYAYPPGTYDPQTGIYTGTVVIAGSSSDTTILIDILPDTEQELDESFTFNLIGVSSNAQLGTSSATITIQDDDDDSAATLYRVNAGGSEIAAIDGGPNWTADTATGNSLYLVEPGNNKVGGFSAVEPGSTVPSTTPGGIFDTERWDGGTAPEMSWSFPVPAVGLYEVRLYMGNGWNGSNDPGERVFDVSIEGQVPANLDNVDLSGQFGHLVGAMISNTLTVSDGFIDIEFLHGVENPLVNGIEIIQLGGVSAPLVDAGPDAVLNGPAASTILDAEVIDESDNSVPLRTVWNLVSGPAQVSFADPYGVDTTASFSEPGVYVLRLTADNGVGIVGDERSVTVLPASGGLITSLDVFNVSSGPSLDTLTEHPLDPSDIQWAPIPISQDQVNNFPGATDGTTGSPATGTANFFYDASTNLLNYIITYEGLTSDLTNIHIHGPANAGESNLDHIFDVFSNVDEVINSGVNRRGDTITGSVNLSSHTHGGSNPTPTLAEALTRSVTDRRTSTSTLRHFRWVKSAETFHLPSPLLIPSTILVSFPPRTFVSNRRSRETCQAFDMHSTESLWMWTTCPAMVGRGSALLVLIRWSLHLTAESTVAELLGQITRSSSASARPANRLGLPCGNRWPPRPIHSTRDRARPSMEKSTCSEGSLMVLSKLRLREPFTIPPPTPGRQSPMSPTPLTHASHVVDGTKIYILGGYVGNHPGGSTDQVWIYDTIADNWSAGTSLPEDRGGGGAAILGRKLYYFGGATRQQGSVSSTVDQPHTWVLDLGSTDGLGDDGSSWSRLADLPNPAQPHGGCRSGFLPVCGGWTIRSKRVDRQLRPRPPIRPGKRRLDTGRESSCRDWTHNRFHFHHWRTHVCGNGSHAELDVYRYRIHVRSANRYVDAASAGRGRCSITDQR